MLAMICWALVSYMERFRQHPQCWSTRKHVSNSYVHLICSRYHMTGYFRIFVTDGLDIAPVALSLISCTILSAPVLLIAGSYAKGTSKLADEYSWVFQLNFPSLIGSAIVMISLLSNIKRRRRCKYRYFAQLAFAQFVQHTSLFTCINLENCSKLTYRIVYFFELLL